MDLDSDGLILRVEENGRGPVLHVGGEIDLATAPQLRAVLQSIAGTVVVDLTDVSFLDSSGIAVLIAAHRRLADAGGGLTLRHPNDTVTRTLEIVGLREWIEPRGNP